MAGVKSGNLPEKHKALVEKHVHSLGWMREELLEMDPLIEPVMGISSWDDAAIIEFGGKRLVTSVDGPYAKRLVMKSALIHSATDVVVKGARPLFALDTLTGSQEDIREMISSLKQQALEMRIPLLGGNTMVDASEEPKCSLTVVGELLTMEPIRDCGACKGDIIALLGEPIWGGRKERIEKAKTLFSAWFKILGSGVNIHASKDVTKGGLVCAVYEVCEKSGRGYRLSEDIPFSVTRNLDNFLVFAGEDSCKRIEEICRHAKVLFCPIGMTL